MSKVKALGKYGWIISLFVLFMVNSFLNDYTDSINKNIKRTRVLGQEDIIQNESTLAISSKLPLVRVTAKGTELAESDIDDSLFYARKNKEIEEVYIAPIEDVVKTDVSAEVKRNFILVSTMENGAVINGRFFRIGASLSPFRVKNINGDMVLPKLVQVYSKSVVIDVDGTKQKVRFGS